MQPHGSVHPPLSLSDRWDYSTHCLSMGLCVWEVSNLSNNSVTIADSLLITANYLNNSGCSHFKLPNGNRSHVEHLCGISYLVFQSNSLQTLWFGVKCQMATVRDICVPLPCSFHWWGHVISHVLFCPTAHYEMIRQLSAAFGETYIKEWPLHSETTPTNVQENKHGMIGRVFAMAQQQLR